MRSALLLVVIVSLPTAACAGRPASMPPPLADGRGRTDVRLVSDEAEAALTLLRQRQAGQAPSDSDWRRLFNSNGYRHLAEREAAMGRGFSDSGFATFLVSDSVLRRATALEAALPGLEHADVSAAAARALAYLPRGTPLRARLYLEIKPATNSFVFTGRDSVPSIFLYVRSDYRPAQLENTIAHELHHIGLNAACPEPPLTHATPAQRMLLLYLGAFGEGQAMLAAAGSPTAHPHAADADSIRERWDRDMAHAPADIDSLSAFFTAVLDARLTSADSVSEQARTYYGVQGPWYTVGWLMAATIERERGRDALIGSLCQPTRFIALYNEAAQSADRRGATLPLWPAPLVQRLTALRAAALP